MMKHPLPSVPIATNNSLKKLDNLGVRLILICIHSRLTCNLGQGKAKGTHSIPLAISTLKILQIFLITHSIPLAIYPLKILQICLIILRKSKSKQNTLFTLNITATIFHLNINKPKRLPRKNSKYLSISNLLIFNKNNTMSKINH